MFAFPPPGHDNMHHEFSASCPFFLSLITYERRKCPSAIWSWLRFYTGWLLEQIRRLIKHNFFGGHLQGIAAPNALELGIDIGHHHIMLHLGFPGSIARYGNRMYIFWLIILISPLSNNHYPLSKRVLLYWCPKSVGHYHGFLRISLYKCLAWVVIYSASCFPGLIVPGSWAALELYCCRTPIKFAPWWEVFQQWSEHCHNNSQEQRMS